MKKFYLRESKKGKPHWYVRENEEFRRINKEERKELKGRLKGIGMR